MARERQQKLGRARLAGRERMTWELIDSLLQNTQGLILQLQGAIDRMTPGDPHRVAFEAALDRAEGVLAEARDRMIALRLRPTLFRAPR